MKNLLLITSFLVYAYALPAYDDPIESNDPRNYKNIEILLLESAVDQDGGYSFSFENDDGSKVSQEGQREIVDDEHAIDRIHGSYSYNDVNGQPVSLTYTADENGFRPVGAHLPTPPPVPLEILRSLKFLATAKPFVDDQLYDYKPKKKVFRGRQYNTGNVVTRSRNSLRSNTELLNDNPTSEFVPKSTENRVDLKIETTSENTVEASSTETTTAASEVVPKSTENRRRSKTETTSENNIEATSETATESVPDTTDTTKEPTTLEVLNESKQNIKDALKETIEKTSELTQSATKETANAAIAAIREEATKLTDNVKLQITKINDKISGASAEIDKKISEESTELASAATVI